MSQKLKNMERKNVMHTVWGYVTVSALSLVIKSCHHDVL